MKKYFAIEKKYINHQLNAIKNAKIDPNNIVLNAAAYQDQISRKFGISKPTRRFKNFTNNHIQISSRPKLKQSVPP